MSGDAGGGRGINHRAFEDLFAQAEQRHGEVEYTVTLQLLEIYNETIRDLLVPEAEAREERSLALSATLGSGRNVAGAAQLRVACAAEVGAAMARGARNRAVAETKMNERSSRSHQGARAAGALRLPGSAPLCFRSAHALRAACHLAAPPRLCRPAAVLTVLVEGLHLATHARSRGCLHLIDLAGSERVGRSGAEGRQLVEAQHINRSLSALGGVMAALAQKRDHVPYRDSKLTQLLQDSLGGAAKSMMFVHVAPEVGPAPRGPACMHDRGRHPPPTAAAPCTAS
jgi:kinesin family protein C2/C3